MIPDFANTRRRAERVVVDCWREVLQRPTVGLHDNFFDVGGTSLHAIQLFELLRKRLNGASFDLLALFQHPTVSTFLDALAAREPDSHGSPS